MQMASITGCDCAESLAVALCGTMLPARVILLALPTADCPWCGARSAEAQPEVVVSLADLASRN
jgi:hypothetical protein